MPRKIKDILPKEPMNESQSVAWIGAKLLWLVSKLIVASLYLMLVAGLIGLIYGLYEGKLIDSMAITFFIGLVGLTSRSVIKRSGQMKKDKALSRIMNNIE